MRSSLIYAGTDDGSLHVSIATLDGREYVVIVCGGGKNGAPSGSAIVAFALPAAH